MIITQTPLRISFAGGGTDFRDYYRINGGAVLSTTIDKYIFCIVKKRFDKKIRVGYSITEMVDNLDELKHELAREGLRKTKITEGVEVSTMADIPSEGSGLGSSSTVTVGLLNAFYTYQGIPQTAETLAKEASEIEIDILEKPIGKQDQYAAACGGFNVIKFLPDEKVEVEPLTVDESTKRKLERNLMLFYTGMIRKSSEVLSE
ncbi:GHMP kinase, partial [Candidatus Aerophobetes bacterium]|nr:GHMP kinase [Candidatus Aerophobetes bacterium]